MNLFLAFAKRKKHVPANSLLHKTGVLYVTMKSSKKEKFFLASLSKSFGRACKFEYICNKTGGYMLREIAIPEMCAEYSEKRWKVIDLAVPRLKIVKTEEKKKNSEGQN